MFSSLRVKGILSQTVHAAYPIVCFPVLKILCRCIFGIVFADRAYCSGILKIRLRVRGFI